MKQKLQKRSEHSIGDIKLHIHGCLPTETSHSSLAGNLQNLRFSPPKA